MNYSAAVMEHFLHPRNAGEMEKPDAVGQAGRPGEGEFVVIHLRLDGTHIAEARFQTFGCGPAIAACSLLTEWVTGKSIGEAQQLSASQLLSMLGGLPEDKLFCADLAVTALERALGVAE